MSFLDNLENNLKSLENGQESADEAQRQHRERTQQRANAQAVAPFAEELKKGPFTAELLRQAARVGHEMRVKVHVAWLGSTLRLEARERRMELRPTPAGIMTVYLDGVQETRQQKLDTEGDPARLLRDWLADAVG